MHVPDPNVPQDETMRALDDVVRAGKVRYIGCSNYEGWRIGDAAWTAHHMHLAPLTSAENQYSLLDRRVEAEVVPAAPHYGVGFPYAPLARGMLTGKYRRGAPAPEGTRLGTGPQARSLLVDRHVASSTQLGAYALDHGHSLLEPPLGWLARKSFVSTVITGATSVDQMRENVVATTAWTLTPQEMEEVEAITDPETPPPFEPAGAPRAKRLT